MVGIRWVGRSLLSSYLAVPMALLFLIQLRLQTKPKSQYILAVKYEYNNDETATFTTAATGTKAMATAEETIDAENNISIDCFPDFAIRAHHLYNEVILL